MAEFKLLVREAMAEIDDLRASIEYDEEYMGGALGFIDELEAAVKQLYESIENGTYQPKQGELPFMEIVRNADAQLLPFKHLFSRIEETHKQGF
ncbi:MAG TPA: hypothetical protein VIM41_02580 [Gammaproteobacteria bacterium]